MAVIDRVTVTFERLEGEAGVHKVSVDYQVRMPRWEADTWFSEEVELRTELDEAGSKPGECLVRWSSAPWRLGETERKQVGEEGWAFVRSVRAKLPAEDLSQPVVASVWLSPALPDGAAAESKPTAPQQGNS
jgi:hypothetical protein